MRWAMLARLFLWVGLAFCGSIWLPAAPTDMDLLDPAHFPEGDDPRSAGHRQTLLKYLLIRMALWVLFAFIFGGFPDGDVDLTPPDESILFLLWFSSRKSFSTRVGAFFPVTALPGDPQVDDLVQNWPWGSIVLVGGVWFLLTRPPGHSFVVFRWGPLVLYLMALALTGNFELFRLVLLVAGYGYIFVLTHLREFFTWWGGGDLSPRSGAFDFVWYPLWVAGGFFLISRVEATRFTGVWMDDFVILWHCALLAYAVHYLVPYALVGWVWFRCWWVALVGGSSWVPALVQPFPPVSPKVVQTLEFVERHKVPLGMGGTVVLATGGGTAWYINRRDRLYKESEDRRLSEISLEIDRTKSRVSEINADTSRMGLQLDRQRLHFEIHQHNQKSNIWRRNFPGVYNPPPSEQPPTDGTAYSPLELEYEWVWVLLFMSGWFFLILVGFVCLWTRLYR